MNKARRKRCVHSSPNPAAVSVPEVASPTSSVSGVNRAGSCLQSQSSLKRKERYWRSALKKTADKKPPIKTAAQKAAVIEYLTDHISGSNADFAELLGLKSTRVKELLRPIFSCCGSGRGSGNCCAKPTFQTHENMINYIHAKRNLRRCLHERTGI